MKFSLKIYLRGVVVCLSLFAQEEKLFVKDSYSYFDLGLGCSYKELFNKPIFGIGYRFQSNKHGFNANLRTEFKYKHASIEFASHLFHYFKPNIDKQFYIGIGPSIGRFFETIYSMRCGNNTFYQEISSYWIFSPQAIFGKSYRSDTGAKRFFEAVIAFPWTTKQNQSSYCPDFSDHNKPPKSHWIPTFSLIYGWVF